MDYKVDESSDVPILEDRSSSPVDFPQESWVVCTGIENIKRYDKQDEWIRKDSFHFFSRVGSGSTFQNHLLHRDIKQPSSEMNLNMTNFEAKLFENLRKRKRTKREVCAGLFFKSRSCEVISRTHALLRYIHSLFTRCPLWIIFFPTRPFPLNLDPVSRITHLNVLYWKKER